MALFRNTPNTNTTIAAMRSIYVSRTTDHHSSHRKWQTSPNREDILTTGVTPEWPRANSTIERFNRTMKTALQAANLEGTTLRDAAQCFIQIYRATPHSATDVSPHAAMHGGREMRMVLPLIAPVDHNVDRARDHRYKEKMKNGVPPHTFSVGDTVIVKQKKTNKLTPRFNPTLLRITAVQSSRVTAQEIGGTLMIIRDASYFRRVRHNSIAGNKGEEDRSSDSGGDTEEENESAAVPPVPDE